MKQKLLLNCIITLAFSSSAFAQFQKGDKVLGFGLNIGTSKSEQAGNQQSSNSSSSYGLSTGLGFAVSEHRLHGFFVNGNYGVSKSEFSGQPTAKSDNYNIGAGCFTKIFRPLGKNFFVFGEANAGFNYSEQKQNSSTLVQKQYGASVSLYPGIAYKWSKRLLLEARFGDFVTAVYSRNENRTSNNDKAVSNNFSINSSLGLGYLQNFGIGARWIIPSKRKA
jgi:hypothetical protein